MSGSVQKFGHLADSGQATSQCQGMSEHLDIWRTGAELPVNVRECPHSRTVSGQRMSY